MRPSTACPTWPSTVGRGNPGSSSYLTTTGSSTASATAPRPDPSTTPTRGDPRFKPSAPRSNAPGKQLAQRRRRRTEVHGRRSVAELGQPLAAAAAGRADVDALGHDRHRRDRGLAGRHHRAERRGLRALPLRIGDVLYVRAGIDRPAPPAHRRADLELRVGRVRVPHRLRRRSEQRLRTVDQQVRVPDRNERVVSDPELSAQPVDLRARGGEVTRVGQHCLEFHEAAQAVDLVEVDPHPFPEEQVPALRHDHDCAERGVERLGELVRRRDRGHHVPALDRLCVVRPPVRDQLAAEGSLLDAKLESPATRREVRVSLRQDARVRRAQIQASRRGRFGVAIKRLQLDVDARHGGRTR